MATVTATKRRVTDDSNDGSNKPWMKAMSEDDGDDNNDDDDDDYTTKPDFLLDSVRRAKQETAKRTRVEKI